MRRDTDAWEDRIDRALDLGDRAELAIALVVTAAGLMGGAAALVGVPVAPAAALGLVAAVVSLVLLRWRTKRRGTTVFGHTDTP